MTSHRSILVNLATAIKNSAAVAAYPGVSAEPQA